MNAVTLNAEQRRFVIPFSGGFSCLGFDVVFKRLNQYAQLLGLAKPNPQEIGQLSQYQQYIAAESAYAKTNPTETFYDANTPAKVKEVLEAYRLNGKTLRIFLGNPETGLDWMEENDVVGTVSRSMGPIRIPLLCAPKDDGGMAILTENIVRILDAKTGSELYRNPQYHRPDLALKKSETAGYAVEAFKDGKLICRFKTEARAQAWMDFIIGRSMKNSTRA